MIRQAISCDICGAEKKQTNHWFVAWEQADELRVSGWNSRNRLRTGAKHLCGQVCMHKLADDFMARVIAQKSKAPAAHEEDGEAEAAAGFILAVGRSHGGEAEISPCPGEKAPANAEAPARPKGVARMDTSLTAPAACEAFDSAPRRLLADEPPRFATPNRRAEAWQRERERTQRAGEPRPEMVARRTGSGD